MADIVKALAIVVIAVQLAGGSGRQPSDWSGNWTSRGDQDVEIVRIVPGSGSARGWSGFVEALLATRSYRIEIAQTAQRLAIMFPGGPGNMLTLLETPLGPEPSTRVVNRGEWWTKYVVSAQFDAGVLDVRSSTSSGWWRDGSPDAAKPKPTDFRKHYALVRSQPDLLVLRVHLADEKGEVEYVQTFQRDH